LDSFSVLLLHLRSLIALRHTENAFHNLHGSEAAYSADCAITVFQPAATDVTLTNCSVKYYAHLVAPHATVVAEVRLMHSIS
jgi:hypothetical protein